jgi:hypothetical protein
MLNTVGAKAERKRRPGRRLSGDSLLDAMGGWVFLPMCTKLVEALSWMPDVFRWWRLGVMWVKNRTFNDELSAAELAETVDSCGIIPD